MRFIPISKKILIPASILVLVIIFAGGLFLYSSSPSFCNLCHFMSPYYEAWKTSKHNQVACVKCHFPP
ncbi:MAG: hypothetical protein GTN53_04670, partial [Candidatus Aminicenantes bacterium]|nr:hypothetical protein [Candidatus Aminicenantes bacterium]NIQ65781.1 hypothetical protein [Candidatus Aminicenantes bacterium]NIT21781.1 hypothetical protein [Candidatus Aminicenantes bacterium]